MMRGAFSSAAALKASIRQGIADSPKVENGGMTQTPLYKLSDEKLQAIRKDPDESSQRRKGAADILAMRQIQRGEIRGAGPFKS